MIRTPEGFVRSVSSCFAVWAATAVLAASTLGCEDDNPHGRNFIPVTWEETVLVEGDPDNDSLLGLPRRVVPWDDRLVVLEQTPPFVRVFDRRGELLWTHGTEGDGPGELRIAYDAAARSSDRLLVLDLEDYVVTELDSRGGLIRTFRLGDQVSGFHMTVRDDTLLVGSTYPAGTGFVSLENPEATRWEPLAWADTLPPEARFYLLIQPAPRGWVTAAKVGPGFFLHDRDTVRYVPFIDPRPIQDGAVLVPEVLLSARALMVQDDSIFMLYGGRAAHPEGERPEIVDVYALDGAYLRSYRLPMPTVHLTRVEDSFVAVVFDPAPSLRRWTPRAR